MLQGVIASQRGRSIVWSIVTACIPQEEGTRGGQLARGKLRDMFIMAFLLL